VIYDEVVKKTGVDPLAPKSYYFPSIPPLSAEQQKLVDNVDLKKQSKLHEQVFNKGTNNGK
jgi:hypothetical protein